jgi:uncharacterized protein (TIGR02677 family)
MSVAPTRRYDPPLEAAKYLSTGSDGIYRAIIGALYDQRELGQVWRRRDEILDDVLSRRPTYLAPYTAADLELDLNQLVEWGTLVRQQETNLSPSEFWKKNHQFAITPPVVALERGLREYLAKQRDHGALDPSLLTNLFAALRAVANRVLSPIGDEPSPERSALRAEWISFYDRFRALKTAGIDFQSAMLTQDDVADVSLDALVAYKQLLRQNLQAFGTRLRDYTDILRTELSRWEERQVVMWMIPAIAADDLQTVARPGLAPSIYELEGQLLDEWHALGSWCAIGGGGAALAESTVHAVRRAISDTLRLQEKLRIGDSRRQDLRKMATLFAACPNVDTAHRVAAMTLQLPRVVHLQGSVVDFDATTVVWDTAPIVEEVEPMQRGRRPRLPGEGVTDTTEEVSEMVEHAAELRREDRMQWGALLRHGPVKVASLSVPTARMRRQIIRVIATCLTKPSQTTQAPDGSNVRFTPTTEPGVASLRAPEAGILWVPAGTIERVGRAPLTIPAPAGTDEHEGAESADADTIEAAS